MRLYVYAILFCGFVGGFAATSLAQVEPAADPITTLVGRLDSGSDTRPRSRA